MRKTRLMFPLLLLLGAANAAQAETPQQMLQGYARAAKSDAASYAGSTATTGRSFFLAKHTDWSCSSCHTADPSRPGRHAVTGKTIAPLAPAANPERFTDPARTEKWFKRNCNDTLGRACTNAEKADVLAYLLTVGKGG